MHIHTYTYTFDTYIHTYIETYIYIYAYAYLHMHIYATERRLYRHDGIACRNSRKGAGPVCAAASLQRCSAPALGSSGPAAS